LFGQIDPLVALDVITDNVLGWIMVLTGLIVTFSAFSSHVQSCGTKGTQKNECQR
jgi:hypothetical protein